MTDRLIEFVQELDQDPDLQQKYKADPKSIAQAYGLEPDDIALLLNNDMEAIEKRFQIQGIEKNIRISHSK